MILFCTQKVAKIEKINKNKITTRQVKQKEYASS